MKSPLLLLALSGIALAQGPLTPPGAPGTTMRSLDQIDPRTPLVSGATGVTVDFSGRIRITQSGSYFLTGNLTSSVEGISIETGGVSVDLRGFSINSSGSGISIPGTDAIPLARIMVRNGIFNAGTYGVTANCVSQIVLEDMEIKAGTTSSYAGIRISSTASNMDAITLRRIDIRQSGGPGISVSSSSGQVAGGLIEDCSVSNAGTRGISLGGGSAIMKNFILRNCNINTCGEDGISLMASAGAAINNTITGCQVTACSDDGIYLSSTSAAPLRGNRIEKCTVDACSSGIVFFPNGGPDMGNLIADNVVTSCSSTGYNLQGSDNLVVRNLSVGNTPNYSLSTSNTNGPVVGTAGTLATTGADAHPQANFSR